MKVVKVKEDKTLVIENVEKPSVGAGQVLIETHYAALNRADLLQREGNYPPPLGWPEWMGLEVSGTVAEVGENVERLQVGDRVCALLGGGGYAEYVVVPQELVVAIGDMELAQAAAIPEAYSTAYLNLFIEGNLQKNETVLVHAGASGVGIAVTQIAKAYGAKVIATVRSDEKAKAIAPFGADVIVNTKTTNEEEVFEQYPVDIVIDCVGGDMAGKCLTKMNRGGRWISIATLGGDMTAIDLREVYKKGVRLIGSTLRSRTNEVKGSVLLALQRDVFPKIRAKEFLPVIYKIYPFVEVEAAHAEMYANKNVGKILLKVKE